MTNIAATTVEQMLATLRIIVAVLAVGIVGLSAVALGVADGKPSQMDPSTADVLLLVLLALPVMELPSYLVLRSAMVANLRKTVADSTEPLARVQGAYTTMTIIAAAMAEGIGLFGGIVCLITGRTIALAGPALAIALLIALFPTREKLRNLAISVLGLEQASRYLP